MGIGGEFPLADSSLETSFFGGAGRMILGFKTLEFSFMELLLIQFNVDELILNKELSFSKLFLLEVKLLVLLLYELETLPPNWCECSGFGELGGLHSIKFVEG